VASSAKQGARFCGLAAHDNPQQGEHVFTKLHNDHCFGLAILDCKLLKTDENKWKMPMSNNREKIHGHPRDPAGPSVWSTSKRPNSGG
jgi:hypothetical protein